MRRLPSLLELNALTISLVYLVFAVLWILLSDQLLIWITNDLQLINNLQTIKGLFYVVITSVFLYVLINISNDKVRLEKAKQDQSLWAVELATWSVHLKTGNNTRSTNHYKLFGLKEDPSFWSLQDFYDAIHPDDLPDVIRSFDETVEGKREEYKAEFRIKWPDGSLHWLSSKGKLIKDEDGKPEIMTGITNEITERKKLEEDYRREKELFESIFENIPVMIDVTDENMKAVRVNKAYEEITGWTQEEIRNKDIMHLVYPDEDVRSKAEKALEEADGTWLEFENFTKSGEKRIQRWANIKLSDGNTIGIGLDVTEMKERQTEVYESQQLLQKTFESLKDSVIVLDPEKRVIVACNKYTCELFGYTEEELVGQSIRILHLNDERFNKFHKKGIDILMEKGVYQTEFVMKKKDGSQFYSDHTVTLVRNEDGEIDKVISVIRDITENKRKERALKQLNERYKNAELLASIGHWKRDLKTDESTVSAGYLEITEIDPNKEFTLDLLKDIMHPDDVGHFLKAVEESMKTGSIEITYRIIGAKSGDVKYIHELGSVDFDEDGIPEMISGTIQDFTEIKDYQEELKVITDRYKLAEQIAHIGHWQRDLKTDDAVWSDGFYNIIELEKGKMEPSYENLLGIVHPDDRDEFDEAFKHAVDHGELDVRYRLIKQESGEVGYYHELGKTEYDEKGNPVRISGTIQDMTKLEEFQIQLKKRNDFIENTLENLPIGVSVNYIDSGEATLMNQRFSEIYGWPKEIITDKESFFECVYPDDDYRNKMKETILADIRSGDPERMSWKNIKIKTQEGEEKIINAKNIPLKEQNLMISTVVDVTAQAMAEKALAESEHNYRLMFQMSPLPMWIFNPENLKFVEVNKAAVEHYGYSRKEFSNMTILDIRPVEDIEKVKSSAKNRSDDLDDNQVWRHIKKNGELLYVNISGSDINYFGNNYRLILANDITAQKKSEELVLSSLVEGENKERSRIAQELHDGLGQYLAAANMNFEAVKSDINHFSEKREKQFGKGMNLLRHAINETAQISRNLMPRVVDDYGLVLAIEALVDSFKSSSTMSINYYHNLSDFKLSKEIEFNLYRIAQEGLSNAVKYSKAKEINIQLVKDELDLILTIDDNGRGFDLEDKGEQVGLGLRTLKTRASALGGHFEIESKPGKGTMITVMVPVNNNLEMGNG